MTDSRVHLTELNHSLNSLQKNEKFYLKVEEEKGIARVVVVKRHFSNVIEWIKAAYGTWRGKEAYDLKRITQVFQDEVRTAKNPGLSLPLSEKVHAYVAGAEVNRLCNTQVQGIEKLFLAIVPTPGNSPVATKKVSVATMKDQINHTLVALDGMSRLPQFQKKGSLSDGAFTKVYATLQKLHGQDSFTLQDMAPADLEAKHLLRANGPDANDLARRAFRLMQLRSLLQKAELIAKEKRLDAHDLERQWNFFGGFQEGEARFLKDYAVPAFKLKAIEANIRKALKPLEAHWDKEITTKAGLTILPLRDLIRELDSGVL